MFESFVRKMPFSSPSLKTGWGNGYVKIPKEHWLYGIDYQKATEWVSVHGGLTYGCQEDNFWVFGFDTAHAYSDPQKWTKSKVQEEAKNLARQLWELEQSNENNCQLNSFDNCEVCGNTKGDCFCT